MTIRLVKGDRKATDQKEYRLEVYEDEDPLKANIEVTVLDGKRITPLAMRQLAPDSIPLIETKTAHRFDIGFRYTCPEWCSAQIDETLREMGFRYVGKEAPSSFNELWIESEDVTRNGHIVRPDGE